MSLCHAQTVLALALAAAIQCPTTAQESTQPTKGPDAVRQRPAIEYVLDGDLVAPAAFAQAYRADAAQLAVDDDRGSEGRQLRFLEHGFQEGIDVLRGGVGGLGDERTGDGDGNDERREKETAHGHGESLDGTSAKDRQRMAVGV